MSNRALLFSLLLFYTGSVQAQVTQKGIVREMSSGKRPVAGVQVQYHNANSTDSDDQGVFVLHFPSKYKPGQDIMLEEVLKEGYELVNETDLQSVKLSNDNKFATDIILAKKGVINEAKLAYAGASLKALTAGLEREKKKLLAELKSAKITDEGYKKEKEALQNSYDQQQKLLDDYANRFARTNFDDVDPAYKIALELYKIGKIKEAIAKIEGIDPVKQIADIQKEEKRIASIDEKQKGDKSVLAERKKKMIETIRTLADMYSADFNPSKAEIQYDNLLKLDSTDLVILRDAAAFYSGQHRYEKAKHLYNKVVNHDNAEAWQRANAYRHLGQLFTHTGDLDIAMESFKQDAHGYKNLYSENPSNFNKENLAISHQYIGNTYVSLGDLGKALVFYESFNVLEKELFLAYPANVDYKDGVAISYQYLGRIYNSLGDLQTSLGFYESYHTLEKELSVTYPANVDFKDALAISYQKLGNTHTLLGDLGKALGFYESFNTLERELSVVHPTDVDFKNSLAISYQKLGETQKSLGDLGKALGFYKSFNSLGKELHEAYPANVDFKNGLAISYQNLGMTYASLGDLEKALSFYERYNSLEKELSVSYPTNVDFKNGLAISYQKLGDTYTSLGNLEKALGFYENYHSLEKELSADFPVKVEFRNNLAISYQYLGNTHTLLGDLGKALGFYESFSSLEKELFTAYPTNVDFKDGLAISYQKLGNTHKSLGDPGKALVYYENFNSLEKELSTAYPANVDFKNSLATSCQKLGDAHTSLGSLGKALGFYENLSSLRNDLYMAYPTNVDFKDGLAISYQKLGNTHRLLGAIGKALVYYESFNSLEKELSTTYPANVDFKDGVAISYYYLAIVLNKSNPMKAQVYLESALRLYEELGTSSPGNASYRKSYDFISKYKQALEAQSKFSAADKILSEIDEEKDIAKKFALYETYAAALKKEGKDHAVLSQAINSQAWYGLLTGAFLKAEELVREGIKLDSTNKFLYTNLPAALLFQGKTKEALAQYKKWASKPFREQNMATYKDAFLSDFKEFEEVGIIPAERKKDVEMVKQMLMTM